MRAVWSYNNIIPTLHIIELIIQTAADNLFINVRKEADHPVTQHTVTILQSGHHPDRNKFNEI